jgi:hypothetical protein
MNIDTNDLSKFMGIDMSTITYEDFTTYTEVDEDSDITITSSTLITVSTMIRNVTSYVYKDFGVDYFGNFEVWTDAEITAAQSTASVTILGMSNSTSNMTEGGMDSGNSGISLRMYYGNDGKYYLSLKDWSNNNRDDNVQDNNPGKVYWVLERNGTTLTAVGYTDIARTNVLCSLSIASAATAWRYLITLSSRQASTFGSAQWSGTVENLVIIS